MAEANVPPRANGAEAFCPNASFVQRIARET